jgi:hypothetical protein
MADFISELIRAFSPRPNLTLPIRPSYFPSTITDLMKDLKECDVILYRVHEKENFVGNIISHMTSSPYCHAAFHIGDGYVIAADQGGVGYDDVFLGNLTIDVLRLNREITDAEKTKLVTLAKAQLNKPYDYWNLLEFSHLSKEQALEMSGGTSFICSELVAWLFKQIDVEIVAGKIIALEAPADLGRSSILDYIGTYINGDKVHPNFNPVFRKENYRNEFLADYETQLAEFVADFEDMFSNTAAYYAQLNKNKQLLIGRD